MAPMQAILRSERDKRINDILKFASSLPSRVSNQSDFVITAELESNISSFPVVPRSSELMEFDDTGTKLWNLSTRLNRDRNGNEPRKFTLLRVFAFYLIDSGNDDRSYYWPRFVRLLKVSIRTAKVCIQDSELELVGRVLERAAFYIEEMEKHVLRLKPDENSVQNRLRIEYLILRVATAWKQSKLDMAEYMFNKINSSQLNSDSKAAEELADTLFEMGKDFFGKGQLEVATRWLERAYNVLGDQEPEKLSETSTELRMAIMHLIAKSHMSLKTPEGLEKAKDFIRLMEGDYGDRMIISLLQLEVLCEDPQPDPPTFYSVLLRMFRSVVLTPQNFKTVMFYIHKLRKISPSLTCQALDNLLAIRLYETEREEWIERTVITRTWISISSSNESDEVAESLSKFFEGVSRNIKGSLTAAAAQAAQTLIWKSVEKEFSQNHYGSVERFCRIALHPILERCGEINKAKVSRKIMQCALAKQDFNLAREAFFAMPEAGRNSAESQLLMYKVGMRSGDNDLASICLKTICKCSSNDSTMLWACVLEAELAGNRMQAVMTLQEIINNHKMGSLDGVNVPAVLRSAIRITKSEMNESRQFDESTIRTLCNLFEAASLRARWIRSQSSGSVQEEFSSLELDWFSRNSYNLALELCTDIPPQQLIRLSICCLQFIEFLSLNANAQEQGGLKSRQIICEFILLCANVVLARAEDNIDTSYQYYMAVQKHAQSLRTLVPKRLESTELDISATKDLQAKFSETVKYELEAVLRLRKLDDLDELFQACWKYETTGLQKLADLAFVINDEVSRAGLNPSHQGKVLSFLQSIINHGCQDANDKSLISRWLRCLFQVTLTSHEKMALHCIDEAIRLNPVLAKTLTPFVATDLEWMATTAFNHAIDFYSASDGENCQLWAEKAMSLAAMAHDDGGALLRLLKEKYSGLVWEKK